MSQEQQNIKLVRRWFDEVWNQGRLETVDELASPQVIGRGQLEHGQTIDGPEHFKRFAQGIRAAFPDLVVTIEDTVAQGEKVVARWSATATHKGEFIGLAPTQNKVTISGISIQKIVDGKIVEGWDTWDQLSLLVQVGATKQISFMAA